MKLKEVTNIKTVTVELTSRELEILYHILGDRNERDYEEKSNERYFTYEEEWNLWRNINKVFHEL